MEGTGRRFGQPTSYQVLFPYVPPAVDQPSYIPPQVQEFWPAPLPFHPSSDAFVDQQQEHQTHPDSSWHWQASQPAACADLHTEGRQAWQKDHERKEPSVPRIIEMPIMSRNFHVFETYYSEEPMTAINPDSPPPAAYESTEFEDILTREAAKAVPAVKWEVPSASGDAKGREVDGLPRKENGYEPREEFQEGAERSGEVSENGVSGKQRQKACSQTYEAKSRPRPTWQSFFFLPRSPGQAANLRGSGREKRHLCLGW